MPPELPRPTTLAPLPRALLIDVGFTLLSFDGVTIARHAAEAGLAVDPRAIDETERTLRAELAQHDWPQSRESTAPKSGGATFFARMFRLAGANTAAVDEAAAHVWRRHLEKNVWSRPLPGATEALARLRDRGIRMAVVSNSEGTVEALLGEVGMAAFFDVIIDSWHVGVTKPDRRIFDHTLGHLGIEARDAMMVGDSLRADIGGAQAVGMRAVLMDPFALHPQVEVPRFPSFSAFADALLAA
ncbi:MAG TPA: HAD-IIIA family hydrolase [Polyangia bacterium]